MKKSIVLLLFLSLFLCQGFAGENHKNESEMCIEHGVLEKDCAQCNPSLIPKFKAKGDWCKEHNLPDSQCSGCKPFLVGKVVLSKKGKSLAGIKTEKVKNKSLETKISITGKVTFNEKKLIYITSRIAGRVEEVFAFESSRVKAGDPLVSLYSPEYLNSQSEYIQAEERKKRTEKTGTEEEKTTANAIYESARKKLLILACCEEDISELDRTHSPSPYLLIRAPFSGSIIESSVVQGNYVEVGSNLFKLADLSTLWVIADAYEKDIALIKGGEEAEIKTDAYPDETFKGKVTAAGDVLDEKTRTFKVRIEVNNSELKLKPEMFIKATIIINRDLGLTVPKDAILTYSGKEIVFVSLSDNTYKRKIVGLGEEAGGFIKVLSGLKEGENIVVKGNFLLKSEMLKSQLGAG